MLEETGTAWPSRRLGGGEEMRSRIDALGGSRVLQKNVGPVDRAIRMALGIGLVTAGPLLRLDPWATAVTAGLGGVQVIESLSGY